MIRPDLAGRPTVLWGPVPKIFPVESPVERFELWSATIPATSATSVTWCVFVKSVFPIFSKIFFTHYNILQFIFQLIMIHQNMQVAEEQPTNSEPDPRSDEARQDSLGFWWTIFRCKLNMSFCFAPSSEGESRRIRSNLVSLIFPSLGSWVWVS